MLAFLSASSSETSWTISGWLNFPARQEDGEKIRTRVHINLSSFIPELIRGSILWPDPCFTPTQNTIPVPSFRFREGPTGIEHLELILFHSRCHHAYGWEGGKELLMRQSWEKLYQAASECLYQELRENSTRMEPRELETISGHSESAINWGDKATTYKKTSRKTGGLGFPRIQTIMQTCLLQTPLCQNPLICAILPSPWPFPDFCLGQQPRSKQS